MGDPKKQKKKYETPFRPWDEIRIKEEKGIIKEFGLKNKKEIWKISSLLKKFKVQARKLITSASKQAELEKKHLIEKLVKLGLVNKDAKISDILELKLKDLLEKRLQTQAYRLGLANSVKQARQFIVHRHIAINKELVTSPSRLVLTGEKVEFNINSCLSNTEHVERSKISKSGVKTKKILETEKPIAEKKVEKESIIEKMEKVTLVEEAGNSLVEETKTAEKIAIKGVE